ncbi:MAG: hypothetical protein ACYC27_13235 [Armatimonadota bacterium]
MVTKILIVAFLVAVAVGVVVSRSVTSTQVHSINEVKSWERGGMVALNGKVTFSKNNHFVIDDGTGKAELSTCPSWYKKINLYENDHITVTGQVSKNVPSYKECSFILSVFKIYKDGEVIEIRDRPGRPSWVNNHVRN